MIKKVFIAAGEPSSDILGADLINQIKSAHPKVKIAIIGGPKMEACGYKSLFNQGDISVMGYFEIITHIFKIKSLINMTINFLHKFQPDAYIAIDSRGFNQRVISKIKGKFPCKFYNYVSPSIWAYRYNRIFTIKKLFDHQFVLFPFEKEFYDAQNIPCTFIGHPLGYVKCYHNKSISNNEIALLPGSRVQEVKTLLPIFIDAVRELSKISSTPHSFYIITLPHLKGLVQSIAEDANIITNKSAADIALQDTDLILTKSGTVSLELMRYNKPMVVAHKISKITAFFIKKLLKTKYVSIGNIIAKNEVIPELLQDDCNSKTIAKTLSKLKSCNVSYTKYLKQLQNDRGVKPHESAVKVIFGER